MTCGTVDVRYVGLMQAARRLRLSDRSLATVSDPIIRDNLKRLRAVLDAWESSGK